MAVRPPERMLVPRLAGCHVSRPASVGVHDENLALVAAERHSFERDPGTARRPGRIAIARRKSRLVARQAPQVTAVRVDAVDLVDDACEILVVQRPRKRDSLPIWCPGGIEVAHR